LKSKKEIRDKTLQVMERSLKELKKDLLSRKVTNCVCGEKLMDCNLLAGYCCSYERRNCDVVQVCHDERASTCLSFESKQTPETVKQELKSIIKNPALCGEKFPKLSALLWVLGGDLTDKETEKPKKLSFKERVKSWLKPIIA